MFEIQPIACTNIDWHRFVTGTVNAIGRSPTRQLDLMGKEAGSHGSYISALGEFEQPGSHHESTLLNPFFLRHLSFSFLIGLDQSTLLKVLTQGFAFAIIMTAPGRMKENFIMTASLDVWQQATLKACSSDAEVELREFYNQIWTFFHQLGLREVFGNVRRKDLKDKTFMLELKR